MPALKKPQSGEEKAKKPKYPEELMKQLVGKTPLEQQRLIAQSMAASRYKRKDAVIMASHLDDGLSFLTIPDLGYQWAMQRPGYAMGKIETAIGFEGVSKTSLQLWRANHAMRQGGLAAGVFLEHADSTTHMMNYIPEFIDSFPVYVAESLEEGIDMSKDIQSDWLQIDEFNAEQIETLKERLKIKKLEAGEREALTAQKEQLEDLFLNPKPRVQIFDSVAGATMEKLLKADAEMGAKTPGGIGGIMADFVNAMKTLVHRTNSLACFNNQARETILIGFAANLPVAELEKLVAKGGRALPFHSSYFEVLKKGGKISSDEADEITGKKSAEGFSVTLTFKKNKYGVPMRQVQYDVVWGQGIVLTDYTMNILQMSKVMSLQRENKRGVGTIWWSREMGVNKESALSTDEMYALCHSEQFISKFQEGLGIVTTNSALEVSGDDHLDDAVEVATTFSGVPPLPPPPPDSALLAPPPPPGAEAA